MNPCLYDLFQSEAKRRDFADGLPIAFHIVSNQMPPGNPAVGVLREHVVLGFFVSEFGRDNVVVPERGNQRGHDVVLCGEPLSIKTVTKEAGIKVLWTVDNYQVQHEMDSGWQPHHDIFLINIFWNEFRNSVFCIPKSVQQQAIADMGRENYLSSAAKTNNRGIEIRRKAIRLMKKCPETLAFPVNWVVPDIPHFNPWDQWDKFWRDRQ